VDALWSRKRSAQFAFFSALDRRTTSDCQVCVRDEPNGGYRGEVEGWCLAKRQWSQSTIPETPRGSGILTLHVAPSPRSSKGLFPEYTVRSGPQDLRTFIIPHSDLSHFMPITLHGSPVVSYSASILQMSLDDSGHDCGIKGGAHKVHRR
jgi:hypothetical protein